MKYKINGQIKLEFLILFFVVLGFFLASFLFPKIGNKKITQIKNTAVVVNADLNDKTQTQYFYINKDTESEPKVSAKMYLVGDLQTGEIILTKNTNEKSPIASISKLMTALVTKEIEKENDIAKISRKVVSTEGGNGGLKVGEKIKVNDLIYPLLLESSNDAAEAIAEFYNRDEFIKKMNTVARDLKMENTVFYDPSGLSEKNQSTVLDIFKLTGYLMEKKQELIEITNIKNYVNKKHTWSNISQFLNKDGYIGGKSGYTDEAKQTVVSIFSLPLGENNSRPIALMLLQSKDRRKDVETILKYLKKNVYYVGNANANTDWIKERLAIPEQEQDFVDLIFAGDIMLDRGVKNSVLKNFKGNYGTLFEKVEILKKSDIIFANLEGTVSDKGADFGNLYSFRMDPSIIPALKNAGIIILSVANNHMGDWGLASYIDTLNRLKENEISYTGGGMNATEAENPTIIERYGIKIGFLGFSDVGPEYIKVGEEKAGILLANNPRFDDIVQNASKLVDYLVVSFHFGDEYKAVHNKRQEYLAHRAIDDGAKIVVGHHPHVAEDTEVYSPKSCTQISCMGYIMYSLGNFIFDQKWSEPTMQGLLVQIKLNKNGNMSVIKNITKQNKTFQIDTIIKGKEEKIQFTK